MRFHIGREILAWVDAGVPTAIARRIVEMRVGPLDDALVADSMALARAALAEAARVPVVRED